MVLEGAVFAGALVDLVQVKADLLRFAGAFKLKPDGGIRFHKDDFPFGHHQAGMPDFSGKPAFYRAGCNTYGKAEGPEVPRGWGYFESEGIGSGNAVIQKEGVLFDEVDLNVCREVQDELVVEDDFKHGSVFWLISSVVIPTRT